MDLNAQLQGSGTDTAKAGDLQGTAASIVHDVLEQAEHGAGKVQPVVSKIPHSAEAPIHHAVHAAAAAAGSMREAAGDAPLGAATQYIRANPRRSLAIAFTAGFLVSRILL